MMRGTRTTFVALVGLLALAGCGASSPTTSATTPGRTIMVSMRDNRFVPDQVTARPGEILTFRFRNDGAARHEAIAGDAAAQAEHERGMAAGSTTMAMGGHDDPATAGAATTVEPGATSDLTVTVPASGTMLVGCHEPGHWEGGMKLTIVSI